jgi:pantothenate kinase
MLLLEWLKEKGLDSKFENKICLAGGGSVRLNNEFEKKFGWKISKADEIESLVMAMNMLITTEEKRLFEWDTINQSKKHLESSDGIYPFILVNVGSGINIHLIKNKEGERVALGGTSLGGGYFWGIAKVLTRGKKNK